MENIFKGNQVMLLKLPDALYDLLLKNPEVIQTLEFESNLNKIEIKINEDFGALTNGVSSFSTKILSNTDDDLYVFSVDGNRKAVLKAKAVCKGNLIPERSLEYHKLNQQKLEEVSKYKIDTVDPKSADIKFKQRIFKLHDHHKAYTMANEEKAILATYLKKTKEKRVREEPAVVKHMLFELFSLQRF